MSNKNSKQGNKIAQVRGDVRSDGSKSGKSGETINREGTYVVEASTTPNKPDVTNTIARPTLAEIKQQRRAELAKSKAAGELNTSGAADHTLEAHVPNSRSIETVIRNGRRSGLLNLSDYSLTEGNFNF